MTNKETRIPFIHSLWTTYFPLSPFPIQGKGTYTAATDDTGMQFRTGALFKGQNLEKRGKKRQRKGLSAFSPYNLPLPQPDSLTFSISAKYYYFNISLLSFHSLNDDSI